MTEPPTLLRVRDVARHLAVHENTVRKLIREGSLASIKAGGSRRVTVEELWRFVERNQVS